MNPTLRAWAAPLLLGLVLLAAWQAAVGVALTPAVLLPGPAAVWTSLRTSPGPLATNAAATAATALGAFALAVILGLAIAAIMALSSLADRLLGPNLLLFQLLPKVALGPLFVVWLGVGLGSRLAFATFVSLFPVAVGALAGLRAADPNQVRLCRALGASSWQVFTQVRVPTSLPLLFAGARIAATLAVTGAVIAEFISSDAGLGHMVMDASARSDTPLVFAALAVLCALGGALYAAVAAAELWARRRWGRA